MNCGNNYVHRHPYNYNHYVNQKPLNCVKMARSSPKRTADDAGLDARDEIVISCGNVSVSRTKQEWNQMGVHCIDNEDIKDWTLSEVYPEDDVTWSEVLNNKETFTKPYEAYDVLHFLASDRHVHFLDELRQQNTSRSFWFYWVLYYQHQSTVHCRKSMEDILREAKQDILKFTLNPDFYNECPLFYELNDAHSPYPKEMRVDELCILQFVCDYMERKFGICTEYPKEVMLPMQLCFVRTLPNSIMFAGEAAYYVMNRLSVPKWIPFEFYVYGGTFSERRSAFEAFVHWAYTTPNVRTILESTGITFVFPGATHVFRLIYTDMSNPEGIFNLFQSTLPKCGYTLHQWLISLSCVSAQRSGHVLYNGALFEFNKYRLETLSYKHYSIPIDDSDPEYSNHMLQCVYHVDRVVYTCEEVLNSFEYRAANSGVFDKSVGGEFPIYSLVEKSRIFEHKCIATPFALEVSAIIWRSVGDSKFYVRIVNADALEWIQKYARELRIQKCSDYVSITSHYEVSNVMQVTIPSTCPVYNSSGIRIEIETEKLGASPSKCVMRIVPTHLKRHGVHGELKWTCRLIRGLEPFVEQPLVVIKCE